MADLEAPHSPAPSPAPSPDGRAVPSPPLALIVMGVSGSGKSTIAEALAGRLGAEFADGDAFHPAANVEKMRAGTPLTDADRWPWLEAIAAWIGGHLAAGRSSVVACSALRRAYRRVLVAGRPDVGLVYLRGDRALIAARMGARRGHYMPASLLDSQFATLEEPAPDEHAITVAIDAAPDAIAGAVMATLADRRAERRADRQTAPAVARTAQED